MTLSANQNPSVVDLEDRIVQVILDKLRKRQMTSQRAREIARFVLKTLREDMNEEELMKVIPHLDDVYTELAPVVEESMKKIEETVGLAVKKRISQLIKEGKIDVAAELSKRYIKDIS